MYIVMGPTEYAQKLTHADLEDLGDEADKAATAAGLTQTKDENGLTPFETGKHFVTVEFKGATYQIWYHEAGTYGYNADTKWTNIAGEYAVPENQYRTRLFFMSKRKTDSTNANAGNLIDSASAGQYKTYLIEYYLGVVNTQNELVLERYTGKQEGKALVYSFVDLEYLNKLMTEQNQYLHRILINGDNYPYSIRHMDRVTGKEIEALYIDKYPGDTAIDVDCYDKEIKDNPELKPDYSQYDIVMQVFLRDVVISVEKEIMFPTDKDGKQLLTEEQKLNLIEGRAETDPYTVGFNVSSLETGDYKYVENGTASIIKRSPTGDYVGYYAVESHPKGGYTYKITETSSSTFPGLILDKTTYETTLYRNGMHLTEQELKNEGYTSGVVTDTFKLTTKQGDRLGINFAEVVVKNYYVEKQTTIKYVAVGNGKVAFGGDKNSFVDTPTETLAYYSGKATGADVSAGKGATFVGWFTDPECTKRVTITDGVIGVNPKVPGSTKNYFIPNANILNADEVTFYAKFETASITIERENALPNQTFVYHIKSGADTSALDMYVTLQCDENGKGKVEIFEMLLGNYTVTECKDWSWRHPTGTQSGTLTAEDNSHTFKFDGKPDDMEWLNDYSDSVPNIFARNVTP